MRVECPYTANFGTPRLSFSWYKPAETSLATTHPKHATFKQSLRLAARTTHRAENPPTKPRNDYSYNRRPNYGERWVSQIFQEFFHGPKQKM